MSSPLTRRSLIGVGAAAFCPLCLPAVAAEPAHSAGHSAGTPPHWDYAGDVGPAQWSELSAEFRTCKIGVQQTPIDVRTAVKAQPGPLVVGYAPMPLRVINNGHTIQVNAPPGNRLQLAGKAYELQQFHFHHPSEHLLAGKAFDLECHFVHKAADGDLAVIGVFIRPGAANASLVPIWQAMPSEAGPEKSVSGVTIDTAGLLPRHRAYYRYMGSLTTPPCSEGITWTVFRDAVQASAEQIRRFAALFPMNARPVQPLNRRFVLQAGG